MKGISLSRRLAAALLALCVMMGCCGMAAAENAKYSATAKGFGGDVFVEIELDADGKIAAITIGDDKFAETPGLGARAQEDEFKAQFIGKSGQLTLGSDIEAITGATVTSAAVVEAVNDALAQANPDSVPAAEAHTWEDQLNEFYQKVADNQIKYAPKVTTLSNGVKIQRTPSDPEVYNTAILKADKRGCAACHQDLAETLANSQTFSHINYFEHFDFRNTMGIETTVRQCYMCHVTMAPWFMTELAPMIHGLHDTEAFSQMGGSCWSCHYTDYANNGEMALWDLVKYKTLHGITAIENVQGEFSYEQDRLAEDYWNLNWMFNDTDASRLAHFFNGDESNPEEDGIYDDWVISVEGEVENPFTITLSELIEQAPSVTKVSTIECVINPLGGPWITNQEITGIPVSWLLEQAGVKEGMNIFFCGSSDAGMGYGQKIDRLEQYPAYLVYQINGKPVPYQNGYPVVGWFENATAADGRKGVNTIRVVTGTLEENNPSPFNQVDHGPFTNSYENAPNIALCNFTDGQIISIDEPHTFEGYAHGFRDNIAIDYPYDGEAVNPDQEPAAIAAIEISMDQGKTWTRCETPDATSDRWVYWYFTWTPEAEGSYVISVRAVRADGMVTPYPVEKLFNVQ